MFGCDAYVHVPKEQRTKLDFKSKRCIFLGYGEDQYGFRLWDPVVQKVVRSRDVIFNEKSFSGLQILNHPTDYIQFDLFDNGGQNKRTPRVTFNPTPSIMSSPQDGIPTSTKSASCSISNLPLSTNSPDAIATEHYNLFPNTHRR